jgi:nucleotide-binding universal stress UspA family protein
MKIKKILVPVDFSENSINALRYAVSMSKESGFGIFILHITDPELLENHLHGNLSPEHLYELICKEDFMDGIKSTFILKFGNVAKTIIKEARQLDIDMIVMGTQGAGNFKENLIGTNTSNVIGNTDCPVLAIPSEAIIKPINKVVIAVDLNEKDESKIVELVDYFKAMDSSVFLAYVNDKSVASDENMINDLVKTIKEKTGYKQLVGKLINSENFLMGIENFALNIEADMLVMITHHRSLLESLLDPSNTKKWAIHSQTPLLAVSKTRKPIIFLGVPI